MRINWIFIAGIAGWLFFILPAKAAAENDVLRPGSVAWAEARKVKLIATLEEIISSKKEDELNWWKDKHDVDFRIQPIQSNIFHRWLQSQILGIAQGGFNGVEPVPRHLSEELSGDLREKGFGNEINGLAYSFNGKSKKIEDLGIEGLVINKFVKNEDRLKGAKKSLLHVSFYMWIFNTTHAIGMLLDSQSRVQPENPMGIIHPMAFYERLSTGAKEDFFIISFPNTIWDEKKCIPEEIVVVKCVPYFGGFQVDYFKSGE
jgi:hypothetical protein